MVSEVNQGEKGLEMGISDLENAPLTLPALLLPSPAYFTNVIGKPMVQLAAQQAFIRNGAMNRVQLVGPEGYLPFTFPVEGGRRQRAPISELLLFDYERYSRQFVKTLQTLYGKSPYFEYYEPTLTPILNEPHSSLLDLTFALNRWVSKQLKWSTQWSLSDCDAIEDVSSGPSSTEPTPAYYQTFAEKTGFLPHASILDLLFNEGPASESYLRSL